MKDESKKTEKNTKTKEGNKPMSTRKKTVLIILSVVLLILISVSAVFTYAWFNKPEDKSDAFGALPTLPPDIAGTFPPPPSLGGDETNPPSTGDNPPPDNPTTPKGIYNFLMLCHDRVALNTDVIMVVNLNTVSNKITVLQIPRDTYIELDYFHGKISALYAHYYVSGANNGEKNPTSYGLRKMCETIQYNMYLPLQGAAIINLDGFRNIVDILGGVEVNIPSDMTYYDETQELEIKLKKGVHLLKGAAAEGFVRFRSGYVTADIGRMDAQKIFMSAMLKKIKNSFNVETIAKLTEQVLEHVTLENIPALDIVSYARALLNIDLGNIKFISMPGINAGGEYNWYHVMIRKNMHQIINENFNIFGRDIPEPYFDINRVFTSTELFPYINELYTKQDYAGDNGHSADDLNNQGIDIPRI